MNKNKNLAFTLAEVLIVIGIIGVVAALTLPNLNHATGDKETVTRVKKIYASLTDAFDRAQVIYGPFNEWNKDINLYSDENDVYYGYDEASRRVGQRISEFLKVSKDCEFDEGCFSSAPLLYVDGSVNNDNDLENLQGSAQNPYYMVLLSDGTSIAFNLNGGIRVDIDGPNKGKNQDGIDRFSFEIYDNNNLKPSPNSDNALELTGTYNDYLYTWWIIQNDNLDYLRCPGELNWETKTSCE